MWRATINGIGIDIVLAIGLWALIVYFVGPAWRWITSTREKRFEAE